MQKRQIILVALISGSCSLLVEIAGTRVLAPFIGNTIFSWAAVIGFVLASLSMGYYIGGVLADRHKDERHLSYILLAAALSTLMIPFMGALLLPFTLLTDLLTASLFGALILVPASLFYGMVSPYAIKLTSRRGAEGEGAGLIFAVSTTGSIAGALVTGFILIPNLTVTNIFVLGAVLMFLSSLLVSGFRKENLLEAAPFIVLSVLLLNLQLEPPTLGTLVFSGNSAYYHIRIIDTEWNGDEARVLFLDNAASSGERPDGSPAFDYMSTTRLAYGIPDEVNQALVIGSAVGTEVEDLKKTFPYAHVDGVEVDAKTVELGSRYFSLDDDESTTITIDDARRYLMTTDNSYDLVLIDVFRGHSVPPHLATKEFLLSLKEKLAPEGVVAINFISSLEGKDSGTFSALHSTFSSVFDNVVVFPVGGSPDAAQNIVLIATDKDISPFTAANSPYIYDGPVPEHPLLTDELNPIELYTVK